MARPEYRGPWLTLRRMVLHRDNYRCQLQLPNCTIYATQVDHIVGLAQGGGRWDINNLTSACKACNVAKGNQDNPRGAPWRTQRKPSRQW
jgi:5-methylcytosine-specific restriction protein A